MSEQPSARRASKRYFFVAAGLALAVAAGLLLTRSGEWRSGNPIITGRIWTAAGPDGQSRIYFVTEEEQTRLSRRGARRYGVYRLHARDARTGESSGQVQTDEILNALTGQGPEILGSTGHVLWLWNGRSLEARDLLTLAIAWDSDQLRSLNPQTAPLLPPERRLYKVIAVLEALVFKGLDARYMRIDATTGQITPLDETKLAELSYSKRADDGFSFAESGGAAMRPLSQTDFAWDSFANDSRWYALLSQEERSGLTSSSHRGRFVWGEVSRVLYGGELRRNAHGDVELDVAGVQPLGRDRFLMGGFLRRPGVVEGRVWHLEGGQSALVISKRILGENEPWQVSRVSTDGTLHWTRSIGLADLQLIAEAPGMLIAGGHADFRQPTRNRPYLVVFVEELSGRLRTLDLTQGILTPW